MPRLFYSLKRKSCHQNVDFGFFCNGPGNGKTLALTSGNIGPPLGYFTLEPSSFSSMKSVAWAMAAALTMVSHPYHRCKQYWSNGSRKEIGFLGNVADLFP